MTSNLKLRGIKGRHPLQEDPSHETPGSFPVSNQIIPHQCFYMCKSTRLSRGHCREFQQWEDILPPVTKLTNYRAEFCTHPCNQSDRFCQKLFPNLQNYPCSRFKYIYIIGINTHNISVQKYICVINLTVKSLKTNQV